MKKTIILILVALAACVPVTNPPTATTTTSSTTTTTSTTTSTTSTTTTTTVKPPVGARFSIVKNQIVDPDGNIFVPVGANVAVRVSFFETGYVFNYNGTATDHSTDVQNWGWNTVRANLICNPPGTPSVADTQAGISKFIDEYTAKKIVVIVACHDVTGLNLPVGSPQLTPVNNMLAYVANKYKDNPYVWYNPVNEPYQNADSASVDGWLALQRDLLAKLRSIAPYAVFVADIPGYGQGVTSLTGTPSALPLRTCNVIFSWHAYGSVLPDYASNFDQVKSDLAHKAVFDYIKTNQIPVIIGEFGDPLTLNEGTAGPPAWNRFGAYAAMKYGPQYGVGTIWWHGTGDSNSWLTYSLMADRHQAPWSAALNGVGLSDAGKVFWNLSHQKTITKFTGNLSDSGCW